MKKIDVTVSGHKLPRKHKMAFISVNSHNIRWNSRNAARGGHDVLPIIRIARSQSDSKPEYARAIEINGPSKLLYSPDEPLMKCGARLVLVTPYEYVEIVG